MIKALAKADDDERAFWTRTIAKGQQNDGDLDHAIALLTKHGALEETRLVALEWAETSKAALDVLPESKIKDMLADIVDYVVSRLR